MNDARDYASAAMFEGNDQDWWITGGSSGINLRTTDLYNVGIDNFTYGVDMPRNLAQHNLINVNSTHMVLLGGEELTDEVFIFNK